MTNAARLQEMTDRDLKENALGLRDVAQTSVAHILNVALIDDQYNDEELAEILGGEYSIESLRILGAQLADAKMHELEDTYRLFSDDEWF